MDTLHDTIHYTGTALEIHEAFFQRLRAEYVDEPESMWHGRAVSMLACALPAVMERSAHLGMDLTQDLLRDWLSFPALVKMSQSANVSPLAKTSLGKYLSILPGFGFGATGRVHAQEQHGYVLMMLTPLFENDRLTQAAA